MRTQAAQVAHKDLLLIGALSGTLFIESTNLQKEPVLVTQSSLHTFFLVRERERKTMQQHSQVSAPESSMVEDFFVLPPEVRRSELRNQLRAVKNLLLQDPCGVVALKGHDAQFEFLIEDPNSSLDMMLFAFLFFLEMNDSMKEYVCNDLKTSRPIPVAKRQAFLTSLEQATNKVLTEALTINGALQDIWMTLQTGLVNQPRIAASPAVTLTDDRTRLTASAPAVPISSRP